MTPEPPELAQLREAVKRSYDMRTTQDRGLTKGGKPRKAYKAWRADPKLVEQLVAAEEAWRKELWRRRDER